MHRLCTWLSCVALTVLLASCAAPTAPAIARLADGLFIVVHPLRYQIENTSEVVVVPVGFLTDLASIPRGLWWWESPIDRSMAAAIVHDYLYWDQRCSKDEADAVLYLAMAESGVGRIKRSSVYAGVRTPFGDAAFKENTKAKAGGESRFFTAAYVQQLLNTPVQPNSTLRSIQEAAAKSKGIEETEKSNPSLKQACSVALKILGAVAS